MNCYLGAVTVIDHLDFELWQKYELTLRATDTRTGSYAEAIIHVYLEVFALVKFSGNGLLEFQNWIQSSVNRWEDNRFVKA